MNVSGAALVIRDTGKTTSERVVDTRWPKRVFRPPSKGLGLKGMDRGLRFARIAPILCGGVSYVQHRGFKDTGVHKKPIIPAERIMAPPTVGPPERGYGVVEPSPRDSP
jgi:hypothetical protein